MSKSFDHSASFKDVRAGSSEPRWVERFGVLARQYRERGDEESLKEFWVLATSVLERYLWSEQRRVGKVSVEDARDIAAQKAFELLTRFQEGGWSPYNEKPGQLQRFFATIARNGLVDYLRVHGPSRVAEMPDEWTEQLPGREKDDPNDLLDSRRVALQLVECAENLTDRARQIWASRVFLDLSSKEIGKHPKVQKRASAVDVALARARQLIRDCMSRHGHSTSSLPQNVFPYLWEAFFDGDEKR